MSLFIRGLSLSSPRRRSALLMTPIMSHMPLFKVAQINHFVTSTEKLLVPVEHRDDTNTLSRKIFPKWIFPVAMILSWFGLEFCQTWRKLCSGGNHLCKQSRNNKETTQKVGAKETLILLLQYFQHLCYIFPLAVSFFYNSTFSDWIKDCSNKNM